MEHKVKYEIDIDAKTPEDAALQVADIMRHGSYSPFLTVISPDGKITDVDLEISTVGIERTSKKDYYLLFIYPGIKPQLKGPFETSQNRNEKAKQLREDFGTTAEYFPIEVSNGEKIDIDSYVGDFFE